MKKLISALLACAMLLSFSPLHAFAVTDSMINDSNTWGADYDTATEFHITSEEDLRIFANLVNNESKTFDSKTVILDCDIDITQNIGWFPIGSAMASEEDDPTATPFAGTFDGQNNTISGLTCHSSFDEDDVVVVYVASGLFGFVSGTVKDVNLTNVSIQSLAGNAGGIAGILVDGGTISGCSVSGSISGFTFENEMLGEYIGGIVGAVTESSKIEDCVNNASITGVNYVGGIAGSISEDSSSSAIESCKNKGAITGTESVGGIIGLDEGSSTVSNCENTASVSGQAYVGGIVGNTSGAISNCQNTGKIGSVEDNMVIDSVGSNGYSVGGIVGILGGSVENCQNSGAVSGDWTLGGIVGKASENARVTACTNAGSVTGAAQSSGTDDALGDCVGGIVGENDGSVSACTNSGAVTGETSVGGIVGNHNSSVTSDSNGLPSVTGCINTAKVTGNSNVGIIVGTNADPDVGIPDYNQDEVASAIVQNNFWPAALGTSAVGGGSGSSESADTVKNNSAYREDGTLTTPVTDEEGKKVTTIGEAADKILGGIENLPDALKATVKFDKNGHGSKPRNEEVVIGSKITLPSMDNEGKWIFDGWLCGDKTYQPGDEIIVTADMTFTAQWYKKASSGGSSSSTTYSVSTVKAEDGKITVSPAKAEKGDTVTITVTPDEGYVVDEVVVTDKNGKELAVKQKSDTKFTFTMPASKVSIEVSFARERERTIVLTLGSTAATVFGTPVVNDVAPIARNNRTMLPIRFVAEALGARVDWDAASQKVTITRDALVIEIFLGSDVAYVGGQPVQLDSPAFAENNRTYLPLRFVAEALGAQVDWDQPTQTVTITAN